MAILNIVHQTIPRFELGLIESKESYGPRCEKNCLSGCSYQATQLQTLARILIY